jgi:HK97 family phage portal protein
MMLADRVSSRRAHRSQRVQAAADPVSIEEFDRILSMSNGSSFSSKAGTTVGPRRALGISAWYSGVLHISTVMAGLPFHRYRGRGNDRERVPSPLWSTQPDVEQPWYGLVEFWMMSLLHKGNAFAFKLRNPANQVTGLREIHPDRVTTGQAPDGTKRFVIDREEKLWTTRDVLHIPGLTYDGRFGLNPIQYNADVLGSVAATDDYAGRFFSNNTNLGGIISVEQAMTTAEAKALREEWDTFHQGILNAHKTGVLSKGARYDRVTLNAEDTQLIESRQYGVLEISRLLRLTPHKLYELSRATFSNIEHQSIETVQDCYQPWSERIEAHINLDSDLTPTGTFHEFNLDGRLRGDTKSRYEAQAKAVGGPWKTVNESRKEERYAPVEGGDVVLQPLAMTAVGNRGAATQAEQAAIVQKVYLGVVNKVITDREARELLIAAGLEIPPDFPTTGAQP